MKSFPIALPLTSSLALLMATQQASAAGYAIREQSATAQTSAFAGATAAAKDTSYMFFNPAALARQKGNQGHVSLSYILPESKFKDGEASNAAGVPITGGDNDGDIADDALVPALYVSTEITDALTFGLGLTAPFGLTTDNQNGWIGRYHALKSELTTININPAVAIEATETFAFGMGLQVQYIDTELTNAIDFGTIGAGQGIPGSAPTTQDGRAKLTADDWAMGFNLGALYMPSENTRFGIAFRSEIDHTAEGDAEFSNDDAGIGAVLNGAGLFLDTDASADVTTPASISIGAYHEYANGLELMAEVAWTDWSTFEELRVEFDNPAQPDSVTAEDWDDSFFVALGARYKLSDTLALSAGVAYDETPIPDDTRTPRVAGADRYWLSFGGDYQVTDSISLNASYTHIFVKDGDIDLVTDGTDDNAARGNLSGTYDNEIDIFTISGTIHF
ncbi:MAG: OmpP1/FadL family transporter [Geminicoccaceae bacterium]